MINSFQSINKGVLLSTDVESLSVLISSIVDLGAKICVLSDISGLPMVTRSTIDAEDVEVALSALSSLVISTGDTIARELTGNFVNMSVRTTGGLLLSTVIDSNPKVVLTAIVEENLETTIIHEMQRLQPIISNAIEGVAIEIKERDKLQAPDQRKIQTFFDSFGLKVHQASSSTSLVSIVRAAKDDLFTLVNSGTISYEMNRFTLQLERITREKSVNQEVLLKIKKEIDKAIEDWKKRLIPE
jgi:predicted regulator of Ras-like GTPase activity (Roadblock/LC7/MglB family)